MKHLPIHVAILMTASLFLLTSCGGGGGGGGAAAVYPRFAYVADESDNSVAFYAVNANTGRLRYQGKISAGTNPRSITVDPSGKYAYVAKSGSNDVSQYSIAADGTLTALSPATVVAGTWPLSVISVGRFQ